MAPLDCGPPAGGKLTKWPTVSKRLDSTGLKDEVEKNVTHAGSIYRTVA